MRRSSLVTAINSISRAAKQQLTPSKKDNDSRHSRHRRRGSDSSSSISSSPYSDISDSESESEVSSSEESHTFSRRSGKGRSTARHHRESRGHSHSRRRHKSRTSGEHRGRRRHHHRPHTRHSGRHDDAEQMVDLLARLLPFYGTGDYSSDALVIDTIHRLPSHALEMKDLNGTTLLLLVCQFAAYDLLPTLLSKGCDVNASNNSGATPLHFACFSDTFSAESAMALVRHGAIAEVVETDWGCTPLHWAAFAGHVELCRVLCIAGAKPTTCDKGGNDPISYSKQSGHQACTALLESFRTDGKGEESNLRWDRMIDGSTGSSFYYNKDTGESLWGDAYRLKILPKDSDETKPNGTPNSKTQGDEVSANAAETVGIEEIVASPGRVDDNANDNVNDNGAENRTTPECERRRSRTSFQSPLDDIVEVESLTSNDGEANKNEEKNENNNAKQESSLSLHSWDKDDSDAKDDVVNKVTEDQKEEVASAAVIKEEGESEQVPDLREEGQASEPVPDPLSSKTNRSFEERISILHEKMEHQLMDKLHTLEEKIAQSQQQKVEASEEESLQLKQQLSESTTIVMQLRTENATKDLEILKLKQKAIHLETSLEESLVKPATSFKNVGDGELNPDIVTIQVTEDIEDAKSKLEKELNDAKEQIASLERQAMQASKLLADAEGQLIETQKRLKAAEQVAADEKASCASMMAALEQKGKDDERVDSALIQTLSEEKQKVEIKLQSLKEEMAQVQESTRNETALIRENMQHIDEQLLAEKARASNLEDQLESAVASHKSSLIELKCHHDKELDELKAELDKTHRTEIQNMEHQLKEEQLSRMELEVASNEAIHAMELAQEKAEAAEAKLKEMVDMVNETENLKIINEKLHSSLQNETEKRKQLHNTIEDMKGRIRVYVRIRPLSKTELNANYIDVLTKEDERTVVMAADPATSTEVKDWEFDKIFRGDSSTGNTQEAVFNDTSLLITSAIDGFNVCIFAYGQTGSGKTYTMFGGEEEEHKGLAPRVAHELFSKLHEKETSHEFEVSLSMLELYTDKLNDLLASKDEPVPDLKIRLAEHTSSGLVEVDGAKVECVSNGNELLDALNRGAKSRASSSTKMNADSSRSHMIATIVLSLSNKRTGKVVNGKLTLVDLAGSERVGKSGAAGQQLKEAQSINKSLSSLGDVIGALTSGVRQHIPYRNHPLTMLMSDSIGGNAKTLMFVCCSPADYNRKESTNSLDFARRCKNVTNNVVSSSNGGSKPTNNVNQIKALRAELLKKDKKVATKRRSAGLGRPGMK